MELTLKADLVKALGNKALAPFIAIEEDSMRWKRDHVLDISGMTRAKLRQWIDFLGRYEAVRGTGTLKRDSETFLQALETGGNAKARKLDKFPAILREYLKVAPKHWVYQYDDVADFWQPYVVTDISYVAAEPRNGIPAYVRMKYAWVELGKTKTESETFYAADALNLTPAEALGGKGFVIESADKLEAYRKSCDYYASVYDKVGVQFNAVGSVTDDVDGNNDSGSYWWRSSAIRLDKDGVPAHHVIDVLQEEERSSSRDRDEHVEDRFWRKDTSDFEGSDDDDDNDITPEDVDDEAPEVPLDIPLCPKVVTFDLRRHLRCRTHVCQLTRYEYDVKMGEKLILPKESRDLVSMLVSHTGGFKDIVGGKSGGAVILCAGLPGTGKTLTAEVYAEAMERPLYSVQCSQLGTAPEELEKQLLKVFSRAQRWKAILLLDEADVYVAARGSDLQQNAIVGVFLRVLEYYAGVLFLTTNRADLVDDAVASRCVARIDYGVPTKEDQRRIWRVLADTAEAKLPDSVIREVTERHPRLTGRDVKNLLKLGMMVSKSTGKPITVDTIDYVKRFKPTVDEKKAKED